MAEGANEARGKRLRAVRELFKDDAGVSLSQGDFAVRLQRKAVELFGASGVEHKYGQSLVNRLEKGNQPPSLQDIEVYTAIDPAKRSLEWFVRGPVAVLDLTHAKAVSAAGKARAMPIADREREKATAAPKKAAKKKGGRNGAA